MIKRVLKISLGIAFSLLLILPMAFLEATVSAASSARTLAELRQELNELKNKKTQNENAQEATENEISSAKSDVSSKQDEILENQQRVIDATNESEQLEVEISEGKDQLEDLLVAYQIASGENIYLEYIFDAASYEDLIYRYAVMEQLMDYQDEKLTEWKDKIEYNNQLKEELAEREVLLNQQIESLSQEIEALDDKLDDYFDISMDIDDEISSTEELIDYYESIGCQENEDLNSCVDVKGDTAFRKPLSKGTITSYFGYRTHPVTGEKNKFHTGVDIGGNKEGTNIYSIANGMVGKIIKRSSCGGNQVYIYHTIGGKKYTSAYLHLLTINVSVGDAVTSNTVIGTVGGGSGTRSYDKCSTGAHLHLGLGTGWYGSTYTSYNTWVSNLVDPQDVLNLPNKGVYWYSR